MKIMRFSIIVPAYKEKEINKVLRLLLNQSLPKNQKLNKILVIASGYKDFQFLENKKIKIIKKSLRIGKAHKINRGVKEINSFRNQKSDIIIIHNSDVLPKKNTIKNLLKPFNDNNIGMTCGRPISMDEPSNFIGFLNSLVWKLHHNISLKNPKAGEVIAFRNIIKKIPKKLVADEAYVESFIKKMGYKIAYMPDSIVFNTGPCSISDFISQREKNFIGHIHMKNKYHYKVSTMNVYNISKALFEYFKTEPTRDLKKLLWLFGAILLEIYARFLGTIDFYVFNKVPYVWKIVKTSGRQYD